MPSDPPQPIEYANVTRHLSSRLWTWRHTVGVIVAVFAAATVVAALLS
jgi:hypothetical protein